MCTHHSAAVKFLVSRGNARHLKGGGFTVTYTSTCMHRHKFILSSVLDSSLQSWPLIAPEMSPCEGGLSPLSLHAICIPKAIFWGPTLKQPGLYLICAGRLFKCCSKDLYYYNKTCFSFFLMTQLPKVPHSRAGVHNRNHVSQWNGASDVHQF